MSYTHLSRYDRAFIAVYLRRGKSQRWIAKQLGVSPSTISREVRRNKYPEEKRYLARVAQKRSESRWKEKQDKNKKIENNIELENYIEDKLEKGWSPEQIAGRMKYLKENKPELAKGIPDETLSCSSIYRWIERERVDLKKYLRRKGRRKRRKSQKTIGKQRIKLITQRNETIEKRLEVGHFEADTIYGKDVSQRILTLVDRKTKFTLADRVLYDSYDVFLKIKELFSTSELKKILNSITCDQGSEFAAWELIEKETNADVYFTHPRSPWEKGTNENTNGLLREYLPKGYDFDKISQDEIMRIVYKLNTRPRKCLGFKTPQEVFFEEIRVLQLR